MASFFDDWNELARNQKSAAEVAADSLQQTISTWADFQLNRMSLEGNLKQRDRTNTRLDKQSDSSLYRQTLSDFTNPVEKLEWMQKPYAAELAKSGGVYQDPATWAEMVSDMEGRANQYKEVKNFGDEFFKRGFSERVDPTSYSMTDIAEIQATADLLGNTQMINYANRVDTAYKLDLSKSYGMKSTNLMRSWLYNPKEGREYLTEKENNLFEEQIDSGNFVQPLKHMMDIASMKLKEDNDIMQLYQIRYGVLEDMEGLGALTVDEFNDAVGKLDAQFESRWRGITTRGQPKVTGQATPVTRFGLPQYEQFTEEDRISLLSSTGQDFSVSDGAVLSLPDNAVAYASIGGGPVKRMTGENLRRTASAQPGAVRLSGEPEHQKSSHIPIEILNKVTRVKMGEVSAPLLRVADVWDKAAVVSQNYDPKYKKYTNISQNHVIMEKSTGVRYKVAYTSQGEPSDASYKSYRGRGPIVKEIPKIRTKYSSEKATITLMREYKDEQGQWKQETLDPISFDEFIKKYTFPMYQLETIGGPANPYNPAGLFFPQGVK